MKQKEKHPAQPGRFLTQQDWDALQRQQRCRQVKRGRRIMTVTVLLAWDGLLLYMIIHCLIEAVYGAMFIAVISIYMGYQMK